MSGVVPIWRGLVDGEGVLHLDVGNDRFRAHYGTHFRGRRVEVLIREEGRQRSNDQNAWLWGVAYPVLAEELGYDKDEHEDLHYGLVAKWGGEHYDKRVGAMVPDKRSSKLTTKEFSEYMEWLVRFAATKCGGILIPLPNEAEVK